MPLPSPPSLTRILLFRVVVLSTQTGPRDDGSPCGLLNEEQFIILTFRLRTAWPPCFLVEGMIHSILPLISLCEEKRLPLSHRKWTYPPLLRCEWQNCRYFRFTRWCFDIHQFEGITTIELIHMSFISYSYFFMVKTLEINCPSNFRVSSTVLLTLVTMLCIRPPELIYLITEFVHFEQHLSTSSCPQPLVTTILFSVSVDSNPLHI